MNKVISYLQVENISKSYGELRLFDNISFSIDKEQRIALVARNGAGKTSLLDIISGADSPDTGKISFMNNLSIAYLSQNPIFDSNSTMLEQVFDLENPVCKLVVDYQNAIEANDENKIQTLVEKMDALNAWELEVKAKQILSKLKLERFSEKVAILSGGQKKRLSLARALLQEPDFLILDEPTNHMDLNMIEWLEEYLINSKLTFLMVTHDRYFLDRVCNEIIELDDNEIFTYRGNYSYFLEKREERLQNQRSVISKARSLMKTELDWIRRMPSARGTKAKYRVDAFNELQDRASKKINEDKIKLDVKTHRLGKKILEIQYISKSFGELNIFEDFTFKFTRGEKVGIIGENGCGKSTLLKVITGEMKPDNGKIDVGETVVFGHYKQDGISFNEEQRVIEFMRDIAEVVSIADGTRLSLLQFLNYFLFPPEMHRMKIKKLSGGEKRRLYLCSVLMKNPNFLILDEPTNDLDIMTLNVLEDYLQNFPGCVLIVSHDRFFMDKIVDHVFVFEGDGKIKDFPGNYSIFRQKQFEMQKIKNLQAKDNSSKEFVVKNEKPKNKLVFSYKHKRELELIENEISELEREKNEIESLLNSGNNIDSNQLVDNSKRIAQIVELLDEKENRWLELIELKEETQK